MSDSRTVFDILASHRAATAPSGILDLNPLPRTLLDRLDGSAASPGLTKLAWREIQLRMAHGAAAPAGIPDHDALEALAANHRRAGLVPLAVGHYRYAAPRPGVTANAAEADPAAAVEERTAFYAAPLAHQEPGVVVPQPAKHRGLHVRYVLPAELFVTNLDARPDRIAVDFGDGLGERAVELDTPIAVDYPSPRTAEMHLAADIGGRTLHAAFVLDIAAASTMPPINETWTDLTGAWSYNNVTTTGHAWVFYGAGNSQITNPILIAEGFPGGYSIEQLWETLDTEGLASSLLAAGNDLVICGFDDGTNYIEANAGVIGTIIATVLENRQGTAPLIVGGASMGGLVTRYALAYMQSLSLDPQTIMYFSFDSPHYGATVPLSIQWFAEVFASHSSAAQEAMELLQSTAAQELLLISLVDGTVSSPSALRTQFVANLTSAGSYPVNCALVGVSNGDITGGGNGTPGGTEILTFEKDLDAINGQLYSAPGDSTQNDLIFHSRIGFTTTTESFPTVSTPGPQLDSAPGGYSGFFLQIYNALSGYNPTLTADNGTFIPVGSALAINNISLYSQADLFIDFQTDPHPSDLGNTYADTANNPHVTVTAGIASFLLTMVGNARSNSVPAARRKAAAM